MAKETEDTSGGWIRYMAGIMKEVGLLGFIVLFISFIFFVLWHTGTKRSFY